MTRREINLRVFRRQPVPHVFFQPRFEPWFAWNCRFGRLPDELTGLTLPQAYDLIGASMRTVHYYTGQPKPIVWGYPGVQIAEQREGDRLRRRFDTPLGPLFETDQYTQDETWRTVEFLVKSADDLDRFAWLIERAGIRFSPENFQAGADYIGDRGEPSFWVPKSPYLSLAQLFMRHEDFLYALADRPRQVEQVMAAIDRAYDPLYEQLTSAGSLRVLNFGENVAMAYLSPRYFETYLRPWYEKRSGQLRRAGIFTHVHIDGHFRPLLPYLAELPFDGLEALTPRPQGDVTLEEIHAHIGPKILLDGIPAVLFLEHHPFEELAACVEKIVALFHPRLVLGISDELPEGGGTEAFRRMRWVADYSRRQGRAD